MKIVLIFIGLWCLAAAFGLAAASSRFNNRGVSMLDNQLTFWLNNASVATLKVQYATDYSGLITQWLDRQIDSTNLLAGLGQLRLRIAEPMTDYVFVPELPKTLRIADDASNWASVRGTNISSWELAAKKAGKSLVTWAEDTLDKASK